MVFRILQYVLVLVLLGCGAVSSVLAEEADAPALPRHNIPFIYYLQGINLQFLAKINPAVAVVDPYDTGLKPKDISWLRRKYGITMLAYLSAGEVDPGRTSLLDGYAVREQWRKEDWYNNVPEEVRLNKDWGSLRIEYWQPQWRAILTYRAKKLAELGYDGMMLDTVDSFTVLQPHYREDLKLEMAKLIERLQKAARKINPKFLVYINGGMELYTVWDNRDDKDFLSLIDGQLKEDTWYNEEGSAWQSWTDDDLNYLKRAIDAGKPVFVIDYFSNEKTAPNKQRMADFMLRARNFGAIPFAADRSLGKYLQFNEESYKDKFSWGSAIKAGILP